MASVALWYQTESAERPQKSEGRVSGVIVPGRFSWALIGYLGIEPSGAHRATVTEAEAEGVCEEEQREPNPEASETLTEKDITTGRGPSRRSLYHQPVFSSPSWGDYRVALGLPLSAVLPLSRHFSSLLPGGTASD